MTRRLEAPLGRGRRAVAAGGPAKRAERGLSPPSAPQSAQSTPLISNVCRGRGKATNLNSMALRILSPRTGSLRRALAQSTASPAPAVQGGDASIGDRGRVPAAIWRRTGAKLHERSGHPLCTLREAVEQHFSGFYLPRSLHPVVTAESCFDDLLVPTGHPSRAESDTYYLDSACTRLLRAHMTVHSVELLREGRRQFVCTGDVYRRDTVDRTHYPVFHQVDGVRVLEGVDSLAIMDDLRASLSGLVRRLFGADVETRWVEAEFPFTDPSLELEIFWGGEWLEVLGCGELRRGVLERGGITDPSVRAWAFGLGLERLAMVLFGIPDIRLFWSDDLRFVTQFPPGDLSARFAPYSAHPAVAKDLSFWVDDESLFHDNDVHAIARDIAGDLVEHVECVDRFERDSRTSLCFRVSFRSMDRSLTHVEVNELYHQLRAHVAAHLPVSLR